MSENFLSTVVERNHSRQNSRLWHVTRLRVGRNLPFLIFFRRDISIVMAELLWYQNTSASGSACIVHSMDTVWAGPVCILSTDAFTIGLSVNIKYTSITYIYIGLGLYILVQACCCRFLTPKNFPNVSFRKNSHGVSCIFRK